MTRASLRHTVNHRDLPDLFRSSHQWCSVKKGVLKTFANFTGKHLCWGLFLITLLVLRPATLLKRYRSSHQKCSIKRPVLKNFAIFTGKHLCRSRFLLKLCAVRPATLSKRDFNTGVFLWILWNFLEHLLWKTPMNNCFWRYSNTDAFLWNFRNFQEHLFWRTSAKDCFYLCHLKIL